ncbi:hypothetical protein B296_00026148 [Ensete ventricosum]|uniref:Uncharacterized protein n=1 Tax=Ensete ventricosum TaxID=4639 RepID=A0A427AS08_ENSVE|nr:hypothetical protein B296_00026148 [Ensete ventricosum]
MPNTLCLLTAVGLLKQEVENPQNLDQSAEILIRFLCAVPGWDIKGFMTDVKPALLSALDSEYEKNPYVVRLESIESINKILEEAHKRIQPAGTVELLGALRGRLCDSNKNLVMVTLTVIGSLASAMGSPVEKSSKVPYITVALADPKLGAEGRKDLFDWLTRHLTKANDLSDASHLLKPTAAALTVGLNLEMH